MLVSQKSGADNVGEDPYPQDGRCFESVPGEVHTKDGSAISGEDYHPISLGEASGGQNGSFAF